MPAIGSRGAEGVPVSFARRRGEGQPPPVSFFPRPPIHSSFPSHSFRHDVRVKIEQRFESSDNQGAGRCAGMGAAPGRRRAPLRGYDWTLGREMREEKTPSSTAASSVPSIEVVVK